ncbi:hypothetical protein PILCRDRAFT_83564 [Piloderma croceum F 1598]|uniref:Uncharacterized protein n=1 Tax=Piloderma croceum (strain F 1598) TaxID=765440 RepID=A0A0C3GPC4_PILCF|nr:hypothetical protein PILCRDRAFT_83564 [Piloderma croceum F 1598]
MHGPPPIDTQDAVSLQIKDISMLPTLPDIYCYSFPRVYTFVCNPDQVDPVLAYWKITSNFVESLLEHFDRLPANIEDSETSTDPDICADAPMRKHLDYNIYVKVSPLQPNTLQLNIPWTARQLTGKANVVGSMISSRSVRGDPQTWAGDGLPPTELPKLRTTNSPIVILNSTLRSGIIGSKSEITL